MLKGNLIVQRMMRLTVFLALVVLFTQVGASAGNEGCQTAVCIPVVHLTSKTAHH